MKIRTNRIFYYAIIFLVLVCSCKGENTVTDIDGNVYHTIKIGNQIWMAENLKVTKYRNGNPIFHIANGDEWGRAGDGAYCNYNNSTTLGNKYGRLYNWFAINDVRGLAPEGWHIPTADEIAVLVNHLKGDTIAAAKMKVSGADWLNAGPEANNESGFSALPGGYRFGEGGTFHTLGSNGYWWTTTRSFEMFSWSGRVFETFADIYRDKQYFTYGLSVRCIKD